MLSRGALQRLKPFVLGGSMSRAWEARHAGLNDVMLGLLLWWAEIPELTLAPARYMDFVNGTPVPKNDHVPPIVLHRGSDASWKSTPPVRECIQILESVSAADTEVCDDLWRIHGLSAKVLSIRHPCF